MDEFCTPIDADVLSAVYAQHTLVIKAEGTLPHPVPQARIKRSELMIYPAQYVLVACVPAGTVITTVYQPTPFTVVESFAGPASEEIVVHTRSGPRRVPVRLIDDPAAAPQGLAGGAGSPEGFRSLRLGALFESGGKGGAVVAAGRRVEATGYSTAFDFREAFEDALKHLPPDPHPYPDKLSRVRVDEIAAELGGFAGFHRMLVRVSTYQ